MPDDLFPWLTPARRLHIYKIVFAAMPLLVLGGYLTDETAAVVLGVVGSVLSTGIAAAHTPRGD